MKARETDTNLRILFAFCALPTVVRDIHNKIPSFPNQSLARLGLDLLQRPVQKAIAVLRDTVPDDCMLS